MNNIKYASFRVRIIAGIIDLLVFMSLLWPVVNVFFSMKVANINNFFIMLISIFSIYFINNQLIPLFSGSSIGKYFCGIKIIKADYTKITFFLLLWRNFCRELLNICTGYLFFLVMIPFGRKLCMRSVHDFLSKSLVVYRNINYNFNLKIFILKCIMFLVILFWYPLLILINFPKPNDIDFIPSINDVPKDDNGFYNLMSIKPANNSLDYKKEIDKWVKLESWDKEKINEVLIENTKMFEDLLKLRSYKYFQSPIESIIDSNQFNKELQICIKLLALKALYSEKEENKELFHTNLDALCTTSLKLASLHRPIELVFAKYLRKIYFTIISREVNHTNILSDIEKFYENVKYLSPILYDYKELLPYEYLYFKKFVNTNYYELKNKYVFFINIYYTGLFSPNHEANIMLQIYKKYNSCLNYPLKNNQSDIQKIFNDIINANKTYFFDSMGQHFYLKYDYISNLKEIFEKHIIPTDAYQNCLLIQLAIKKYELKNKKLPDDLNFLQPEYINNIPKNIFNDIPIKYSKDKKIIFVHDDKLTEFDDIEKIKKLATAYIEL
ncbi:MAG: hypothetical protein ACD_79C00146G0005 [uncultured bacterium]|nr:MAG: hypothetical protein ACD_79C00146G0005 [uncultured bacterium]